MVIMPPDIDDLIIKAELKEENARKRAFNRQLKTAYRDAKEVMNQ